MSEPMGRPQCDSSTGIVIDASIICVTPPSAFLQARAAVRPHHQQVGLEIGRAREQQRADVDVGRHLVPYLRRNVVPQQVFGDTLVRARFRGGFFAGGGDRHDDDVARLAEKRQCIGHRAHRFTRFLPRNQHVLAKRRKRARVRNRQDRAPGPDQRGVREIAPEGGMHRPPPVGQ